MGLYDGIKDVAKVIQKADNIELYQKLLDLSSQALDMQDEIAKLREENKELKKKQDLEHRIVRYKGKTVVALNDDGQSILYCSNCWDTKRLLVQVSCNDSKGQFECQTCKAEGIYDDNLYALYLERNRPKSPRYAAIGGGKL